MLQTKCSDILSLLTIFGATESPLELNKDRSCHQAAVFKFIENIQAPHAAQENGTRASKYDVYLW